MKTFILANWKSNKTRAEAIHWFETFLELYTPKKQVEIIIAPPTLYLETCKQILDHAKTRGITLAAQNISAYPMGSYTGETAGDMLKDFCTYVLVGHSERRRYLHESHTDIARKVEEAQNAGITPILCLDRDYARTQIAALGQDILDQDLLIGYGPVDGVNLEIPQEPAEQQEAVLEIQKIIPNHPILYGGSVRSENGIEYLQLTGVSGLMVGSSSLDPAEFAQICAGAT